MNDTIDIPLQNGVPYNDNVSLNQWKYYYIDVPSGASKLEFKVTNLTNDVNLYTQYNTKPTLTSYSCRPYSGRTTSETCTHNNPSAGRWWAGVYGYSSGSYTITATITTAPTTGITLTVNKAGTGTGTVTAGANCTLNWVGNTGTCTVNSGTGITLTGSASTGSTWAGWSNGTGSAGICSGTGTCSFNITTNSSVTATFNAPTTGITVISPNGGENWPIGSSQTIRWTSSGASRGVTGNVRIDLSRNGGSTWETLFPNTANDGSEVWSTVTGTATTQARIRVVRLNNTAIWDMSDNDFTISDTTAPSNPSISINNGAESTTSTSVTLTLSAKDNVGVTGYCAKETSATPSSNDSCWTSVTSTTSYSADVSFTLSSGSGTKTVYVWFRDSAGNVSTAASDSITLTVTNSGATITFSSNRDGNYEIYVMNPDGTNQTRLTNNSAIDSNPSWSPDGNKIVFQSDRDGNYEIYVMNADGTNQTRLTNNSATDGDPSWSPDGTKIAFMTNRDGINADMTTPGVNEEVYVMNADGTNPVNLTKNSTPNPWYNNSLEGQPQWSPDGTKIVFSSWRSGEAGVWVMNADGSNPVQLTSNWTHLPSWSPDGTKIAYSGYGNIFVMNADGSNQHSILNVGCCEGPYVGSWSPDGTKMVIFSDRFDGNFEIYTINSDGSNLIRLTNNLAFDVYPSWSPVPLGTPTRVNQYNSDGVTVIPEGGTTNGSTVIFKGTVSDPGGEQVKMQIELRQMTEAFTGTPTWESSLVNSGTSVSWTSTNLVNASYKWRYRAMNARGFPSAWVEFGASGNTDFVVNATTTGITVTSPNGGEYWLWGSSRTIHWSSSGITGNVRIDLSRNGGSTWETLFPNTANDGSEDWRVAGTFTTQARIRVVSLNNTAIWDMSDKNFTIGGGGGEI